MIKVDHRSDDWAYKRPPQLVPNEYSMGKIDGYVTRLNNICVCLIKIIPSWITKRFLFKEKHMKRRSILELTIYSPISGTNITHNSVGSHHNIMNMFQYFVAMAKTEHRLDIWLTYWEPPTLWHHYNDVIMGMIASQITSLTIVYSIIYSEADQRKHQSSVSLAIVWGIHRQPVNSPHKWPVMWKMFAFDDVIM